MNSINPVLAPPITIYPTDKIIPTYEINESTLALLLAKQIDYDTIALENNTIQFVEQTPFQLIKEACVRDWSTYEGKRQAFIHHTNFKQRTPIPDSPTSGMYFFPTESPKNINNIWIAAQHIARIKKPPRHKCIKGTQSMVVFKGGKTLPLDISLHSLRTQWERTIECMYKIKTG